MKIYRSIDDGYNLSTLYASAYNFLDESDEGGHELVHYHYALMVVETSRHEIFGCFITGYPMHQRGTPFVGTAESFVFTFGKEGFKPYLATNRNEWFMLCELECLTIGSGDDGPALRIDRDLNMGTTNACETFDSPMLVEGEKHVDDEF